MTDDRPSRDLAAVLVVWWRLTWRMVLASAVLTAGLAVVARVALDGTLPPQLRGPMALLASLWAVRAILRRDLVSWSAVLAAWWALVWRMALVGGALFAAASWALGTVGTDVDYLLVAALWLPISLWAAWGILCVIERRVARAEADPLNVGGWPA